ncbi:dienelactone hydrolase family protein [Salinactinospora qingdaonensis]|uniref:Acetyl xylan esterase (AXE1) n=1 Tax=Salinactinospora qingdaonensis TaxID=702744 RepID=A0ABP7FIX7_9ACTN
MAKDHYTHLGAFSDWTALPGAVRPHSAAPPDPHAVHAALDAPPPPDHLDVTSRAPWYRDGVTGQEVSWWPGFGPRTRAWVLRPAGEHRPLPGVLALHCHSGMRAWGRHKIADGPDTTPPEITALRRTIYEGAALATEIARQGYTVLVHDAFGWGSRSFRTADMPQRVLDYARAEIAHRRKAGETFTPAQEFDVAARHHEPVLAKYCGVLGTSLAAMVLREDRIALDYLTSRADVHADRIACVGLSGGGCRAALLHGLDPRVRASVISCMMSTFAGLLDRHIDAHTWMLLTPGLSAVCDWPDVPALRAPAPLLVQYATADRLFSDTGMRDADALLRRRYAQAGAPDAYTGAHHRGDHALSAAMRAQALDWLAHHLH